MSFGIDGAIDKTNMMLDLISVKQQALSSNLANVSTPGYVRQDIDFQQFFGGPEAPLETKMTKQMGPSPIMNERGGKVSMSEELMAMQKNAILYTIATRRATSIINELKTVSQVGK